MLPTVLIVYLDGMKLFAFKRNIGRLLSEGMLLHSVFEFVVLGRSASQKWPKRAILANFPRQFVSRYMRCKAKLFNSSMKNCIC